MTYSAYNKVSEGIPWWGKVLLIGGGIGGVIYLGYYFIKQYSGPLGGSCATPGTPCYTAVQPYYQAWQICATQYSTYLSQYLQEDSANNTGLTQTQLTNLNYLTNCMNNNANGMANQAHKYAPSDVMGVLASYIGTGIEIGIAVVTGAWAAKQILSGIRTIPRTGYSSSQVINDSILRFYAQNSKITPSTASAISNQYDDIVKTNISGDGTQLRMYYENDYIDYNTYLDTYNTDSTDMTSDANTTLEDLRDYE